MDVRCDKCGTEYEFDENRIGANGVTVKCTACGFVFKVRRPGRRLPPRASTHIGQGPQGREWLVRRPDGQMIAFRELTTLQKWIVEGRINRDDEISKNGETWKRLGNIMELEPFFSVYEKAQTLNTMIEHGAEGQRLEIRGSELLSAMSPVDPSALAPGANYTIPPEHAIVQADGPPQPSQPSQPPQSRRPSVPSAAIARQTIVPPRATIDPPSASMVEPFTPIPADAPTPSPGGPPNGRAAAFEPPSLPPPPAAKVSPSVEATRPIPPTSARIDRGDTMSTNLAGPGALDRTSAPPASFGSETLDFQIADVSVPGEDPVEAFERGRRRTRVSLLMLLFLFAGVGAAIAYALYGPPENPARKLAQQYGLLEVLGGDDGAAKLIEEAEREADRDTLGAQQKRIDLLAQAMKIRPQDPAIIADGALALSTLARSHTMRAEDLERSAANNDAIVDAWKKSVAAMKAKRRRTKDLPAAPSTPDPDALREDAKASRRTAQSLTDQAAKLVDTAIKAAPDSLESSRALAARHLAISWSGLAQAPIEQAKRASAESGQTDAQTLYLESVSVASDLSTPEPAKLERAAKLAEQALTSRPTMNGARVWLARIHLLSQRPKDAQRELEKVLADAPGHEEAKRLMPRTKSVPAGAPKRPLVPPPERAATTPTPETAEEPEKDFEYWMKRADRLRERDRTKSALNAYGRAAELRPNSAETHTGKGWCFLDLERPRLALTAFDRALRVNDRYAEAHYGRAESYRALGDDDKAIGSYQEYLNQAPNGSEKRAAEMALKRLRGE